MKSKILKSLWLVALAFIVFISNHYGFTADNKVSFVAKEKALNIYFLDVGQGDAIFMLGPNNETLLIDGGPDNKVIEELGEVLPFSQKKIDHLILSHPHADHVGGLPEDMNFSLIEPLRNLFKDEVRRIGEVLGLPEDIVWRQPFPGPGLAIRVIGKIDREKLEILRDADAIIQEEIKEAGIYKEIWQSFAVLPDLKSVGVMGDVRTYGYPLILRAVTSDDAMTADWARLPYSLLETISNRIVNEVKSINRVVYDITSKPPGTIEWE